MKLLLLVCLCLSPAAEAFAVDKAAVSSLSKRIVGGEVVSKGEVTFLASLWFLEKHSFLTNTGLKHLCGATLIAPRWVVTAAHCFRDSFFAPTSVASNWLVVLGEHYQNVTESEEQKFSIEELIIHPNYSALTHNNDLALVKLNASAVSNDYVSIMAMDNDPTCAVAGRKCYTYGWGQTTDEVYGYGMVLPSSVDVTLIETQDCIDVYKNTYPNNFLTGSEICALSAGKDSCYGDSGGPLLCTCNGARFLSGVVSRGLGCAHRNHPGVYERVGHYSTWIASTISQ